VRAAGAIRYLSWWHRLQYLGLMVARKVGGGGLGEDLRRCRGAWVLACGGHPVRPCTVTGGGRVGRGCNFGALGGLVASLATRRYQTVRAEVPGVETSPRAGGC
jgi:hypothetical protein